MTFERPYLGRTEQQPRLLWDPRNGAVSTTVHPLGSHGQHASLHTVANNNNEVQRTRLRG